MEGILAWAVYIRANADCDNVGLLYILYNCENQRFPRRTVADHQWNLKKPPWASAYASHRASTDLLLQH